MWSRDHFDLEKLRKCVCYIVMKWIRATRATMPNNVSEKMIINSRSPSLMNSLMPVTRAFNYSITVSHQLSYVFYASVWPLNTHWAGIKVTSKLLFPTLSSNIQGHKRNEAHWEWNGPQATAETKFEGLCSR